MRILIYAMGSAGDVHPFAGIGRALQSRGHEVFVITSPYFEDVVRRAGLEFRPMGSIADFERVQADPHLWHPTKALPSIIRNAVDPSYEPILEHARELSLPGQTVILASSLGWGAMVAKELLGIPVATVHLAPSLFISSHRQPVLHGAPVPQGAPGWMKSLQWWAAGKVVDFHVLPALNRFRKAHGLPPARGMLSHWHSPDRVIALFPDWFGPPQPDWPAQTRVTGFPMFDESGLRELPADLEDFLNAGEPPVVFTPGSAMSQGSTFFREAAGALKLLGRRGILLSRFADTIPADLPAGYDISRTSRSARSCRVPRRWSITAASGPVPRRSGRASRNWSSRWPTTNSTTSAASANSASATACIRASSRRSGSRRCSTACSTTRR